MKTYEDVVAFLKQYVKAKYDIEYYRHKMEGLKAISYSEEEKGTSMQDTMSLYMQKIEFAEKVQKRVELFIENKFEGLERNVLYGRYVECRSYKSIAKDIGYSVTHTQRLHERAIHNYLANHY